MGGDEQEAMARSLRVKNLPPALSRDAVESLLTHYGASRVRVLRRKKPGAVLRDAPEQAMQVAIAEFPSQEKLQSAQTRLSRIHLAGRELVVEAIVSSEGGLADGSEQHKDGSEPQVRKEAGPEEAPPSIPPGRSIANTPAPLAPHLGLHYPPSPLLRYKYPKASVPIVRNIANALIALPRFYTQVLHLMNKMNLPTPFEKNAIPGRFSEEIMPELMRGQSVTMKNNSVGNSEQTFEEEEDDEYERKDDEVLQNPGAKRPGPDIPPSSHKRQRHGNGSCESGSFVESSRPGVISAAELDQQRLSCEEQARDPAFANYEPGIPSSCVRVNNLAETVDLKDLEYIFGHVLPQDVPIASMKIRVNAKDASAQIVFPSLEVSQAAVEQINGVVIDGKAAVVCFDGPNNLEPKCLETASSSTSIICNAPHITSGISTTWERMDPSELKKEKAMKNYSKGEPTHALYLKNLSRGVNEVVLRSICAPYLMGTSAEPLNIRHFSEGRMKNQAFIEFSSVDLAASVLEGLHGMIVHGKPIIVSFRKASSQS